MRTYTLGLAILCGFLVACDPAPKHKDMERLNDPVSADVSTDSSMIPATLDTTVFLMGLDSSNFHGQDLTGESAKNVLYTYFKLKGFYTADNLQDSGKYVDSLPDKLMVSYDTIITVDLNGSKRSDAIISYWITPPNANGHCWQPHKATVVDTDKGYHVLNEEFIPSNFVIDSVVSQDSMVMIFGFDYDCGNHKELRKVRVRIR